MPTRDTSITAMTIAMVVLTLLVGCRQPDPTATHTPLTNTPFPTGTPISAWQLIPTSTSTPNRTESSQTAADDVTVGLYAGGGAANECAQAARKMFEWMGYTVTRLDADMINQSKISHIDVVYFPGGSSGPYREDISAEGREKIRRLIHSGGCFIGTCAGALFAAERVVWEGETDPRPTLGLFPGTVEGPLPEIYTDPEYGMCQVNLEPHPITAAEPDSAWILYYNGPFFSPNPDAEVDIVGRYEITNDPALVAFEYGRGRVFLTGPHPEWEEDDGRDGVSYFDRFSDQGSDWDLMLGATRWCLRGIDTLTLTATPTPAPTPVLTATPTPLPTSVLLEPMNHPAQTYNNCGPTSVAITLGYYDQWVTQQEIRTWFYYPLSSDGGPGRINLCQMGTAIIYLTRWMLPRTTAQFSGKA
jgi:glutamine amidotransferase-like uncharacterized protein